jgi:hypothetical protein
LHGLLVCGYLVIGYLVIGYWIEVKGDQKIGILIYTFALFTLKTDWKSLS